MNETAILVAAFTGLWGVTLGLVTAIWAMLKERIRTLENTTAKLTSENTAQEVTLGRLLENAKGREEAHAQHREDVAAQFGRIEGQLASMNGKLDTMMRGRTPYPPTGYGLRGEGGTKT